MALKDLLVYLDQTHSAPMRLRLAADLACRNGSRLTALFVNVRNLAQLEQCGAAELGLASAGQYANLSRDIDATIGDAGERLQALLSHFADERGLKFEWCCVDGFPEVVVAQHARYADMCILGHDDPGSIVPVDYTFSEHMLFVAGRPVLLVPTYGSCDTLGHHIAVAWNSSRAASRALNDALPLLEHCERTSVLCVNSAHYIGKHGALPPERLLEHLSRHEVPAELIQIENIPTESIAEVLQDKARELGADLLVSGAFGHAKLREKLLGGVTCNLLARMRMPLLMSH